MSTEELEVEEEPVKCPETDSDAACMFEKCLARLEHQPEAISYNTSTVRLLQILACQKRTKSLRQLSLLTFFTKKS